MPARRVTAPPGPGWAHPRDPPERQRSRPGCLRGRYPPHEATVSTAPRYRPHAAVGPGDPSPLLRSSVGPALHGRVTFVPSSEPALVGLRPVTTRCRATMVLLGSPCRGALTRIGDTMRHGGAPQPPAGRHAAPARPATATPVTGGRHSAGPSGSGASAPPPCPTPSPGTRRAWPTCSRSRRPRPGTPPRCPRPGRLPNPTPRRPAPSTAPATRRRRDAPSRCRARSPARSRPRARRRPPRPRRPAPPPPPAPHPCAPSAPPPVAPTRRRSRRGRRRR